MLKYLLNYYKYSTIRTLSDLNNKIAIENILKDFIYINLHFKQLIGMIIIRNRLVERSIKIHTGVHC